MTTQTGKKAGRKRKRARRGDSPINVGGGGGHKRGAKDPRYVEIDFDHNNLVAENSKTYQFKGEVLVALEIDDIAQTVDKTSTVTITCLNPETGKNSYITINGNPYGITFNPDDYPYDFSTHEHTSSQSGKPRVVTDVDIDGKSVPNLKEFPLIKAHNLAKLRSKRVK